MPTYEYGCPKCGHEFEAEQRITDEPLKSCPRCRSRKVKRLISRTSFVLKGGGWYSDLYSSKGGKSKEADTGDAGATGKSGEAGSKSDAKTESKTDTAPSSPASGDGGGKTAPESKPKAKSKAA